MSNSEATEKVLAGYRMPCPSDCPKEIYDLILKCWRERAEERPNFTSVYEELSSLERKFCNESGGYYRSTFVRLEEPGEHYYN